MRGFIAARGFIGDRAARRAARASSRTSRSLRDHFGRDHLDAELRDGLRRGLVILASRPCLGGDRCDVVGPRGLRNEELDGGADGALEWATVDAGYLFKHLFTPLQCFHEVETNAGAHIGLGKFRLDPAT